MGKTGKAAESKDKEIIPKMMEKIKKKARTWAVALAVLICVGCIQDAVVGLCVLLLLAILGGAKILEAAR